tara:strand:- start:310 stop:510 length:201 start_codon:yes stop_codon:yes gene_type:complete
MHQITERKAASENLPAAKIKGFEVSKRNDIAGNEDPQKKIVEDIANIGTIFFINYSIINFLFFRKG